MPATEGRGWNSWNGRLTVARTIWGGEARRDRSRLKKTIDRNVEFYRCKLMKASMEVFGLFWYNALPLSVAHHVNTHLNFLFLLFNNQIIFYVRKSSELIIPFCTVPCT